jgi:hypothetical protein
MFFSDGQPVPGTFLDAAAYLLVAADLRVLRRGQQARRGDVMDGNIVGMVAVIMVFLVPLGAMYTFYRVRKLRSEERLAAITRGVSVPMQPELPEAARSRRSGILLVTGALGYMATFALIARVESEAWTAAAFGLIPLAIGVGFFLDSALIRRDMQAS